MRGRRVRVWHPDSPGVKLTVWRPWWRRKSRPFASSAEVGRYWRWNGAPDGDYAAYGRTAATGAGVPDAGENPTCPLCRARPVEREIGGRVLACGPCADEMSDHAEKDWR